MDDYREQNDESKYYNGVKLHDEDFDYLELAMQVLLEKIKVKNIHQRNLRNRWRLI